MSVEFRLQSEAGEGCVPDLCMPGRNEMKSERAEEIFALFEERSSARPAPMEFEMAYQARVAMDRIRFAIRHCEQFAPGAEHLRVAGFQLLDALERLQALDRRFQVRSRTVGQAPANGHKTEAGSLGSALQHDEVHGGEPDG